MQTVVSGVDHVCATLKDQGLSGFQPFPGARICVALLAAAASAAAAAPAVIRTAAAISALAYCGTASAAGGQGHNAVIGLQQTRCLYAVPFSGDDKGTVLQINKAAVVILIIVRTDAVGACLQSDGCICDFDAILSIKCGGGGCNLKNQACDDQVILLDDTMLVLP